MAPPRYVLLTLLALLAFLLILPACQRTEQKGTAAMTPACNWPPDTMLIRIQGSGRILVRFIWRDPVKRASPCPDESFVLNAGTATGSPIPILLKESHTPQDTTPSGMVAAILGGPPPSSSDGTDLLFFKWPPDTTTGGSK